MGGAPSLKSCDYKSKIKQVLRRIMDKNKYNDYFKKCLETIHTFVLQRVSVTDHDISDLITDLGLKTILTADDEAALHKTIRMLNDTHNNLIQMQVRADIVADNKARRLEKLNRDAQNERRRFESSLLAQQKNYYTNSFVDVPWSPSQIGDQHVSTNYSF